MPQRHLRPRLLEKLLRGEATPAEARELALHLLEACPDCGEAAGSERSFARDVKDPGAAEAVAPRLAADPGSGPGSGQGVEEEDVLDRVRRRLQPAMDLALRQRAEAPGLLAELQRHPLERQRMLLRNNPRYLTLPVIELMLEDAWERGFEEPADAEAHAALAVELLDAIDEDTFGSEVVDDVRGRAWAFRGNFRRIQSDLRGAEEAFQRADELLADGTGDLLETARLLHLRATLRRVQMRHQEAGELLDEAIRIYLALDESHLAGRSMVSQAIQYYEQGEPERAIRRLQEARGLIEPERDPYLMRIVQQNLVVYLSELGRYEQAMSLVPALRSRVVREGTRIELLRLRWQEGKILLGLGHEPRAEAAFLEVRKGFAELGIAHDTAAVSLELAALYLRQGRSGEIRALAAEMLPLFQSRDLRQEATAALLVFQRAVEMETLTARVVEEVAEVIRRSRSRPDRRDEKPS